MNTTVLLVGGSSSVGKTTVAKRLASRLGWDVVHADEMVPRASPFDPLAGSVDIWDRPTGELCEFLVHAAVASGPILRAEVDRRRATASKTVVEGERIHPDLVAGFASAHDVRGVFIVETDSERLYQTLMTRSRSFRALDERRRRSVADVDRLYGKWLLRECANLGVPWVPSHPSDNLEDRLLEAF